MTRAAATLLLALFTFGLQAQEVSYVSDQQFIPLRSGPGSEYRILHRGIPSGTELTVNEGSEDGTYSRITTAGGTEGWIRSQYLMQEAPARTQLAALQQKNQKLEGQLAGVNKLFIELRNNYREMSGELTGAEEQLALTDNELNEIRLISTNALTLDSSNRQLVQEAEVLKSRITVLEADNQRLLDSGENAAFLNGALAVGLGVMITLLVPRLWPSRRRSSSWA